MVAIIKYRYNNIIYIYVQTSGRAVCHKNGQSAGIGWLTVVSMLRYTGVGMLGPTGVGMLGYIGVGMLGYTGVGMLGYNGVSC